MDTLETDKWRLTVKLKSHRALIEYMHFHRIGTAYELARRSDLKPGVVGHLVARRRTSCSLATARAIEEALQCPPGFLFEPRMSQVADTKRLREAS
ncbi:MAG TPA: helix-turn-helix transcriptional regulator [Nocardioidaceae bacterium]|nr:helix-turn-helix transcriptional regulator [Nocardioidaceae bacterium]